MTKSKTLLAAATAAAFAFAGSAIAQQPIEPPQEDMTPPTDTTMPAEPMPEHGMPPVDDTTSAMPETQVTEADLRNALEQVGYSEIENVDIDAPMWSVEAINPQGEHVLVQIDASTATIVAEQPLDTEDAE
jgi:hypothetical protein